MYDFIGCLIWYSNFTLGQMIMHSHIKNILFSFQNSVPHDSYVLLRIHTLIYFSKIYKYLTKIGLKSMGCLIHIQLIVYLIGIQFLYDG